jgi:hypothetical protein
VPRSEIRFLDLELRASIRVGDVDSKRQVLFTVLEIIVRNVLFVDPVLISVNPVVPDDVVL